MFMRHDKPAGGVGNGSALMNKLPPLAFTLALGLAASPAFAASLLVFSSGDATQDSTLLGILDAAGHTYQ